MKYIFNQEFPIQDFEYVYSPACKEYKIFQREPDCFVNERSKTLNDYDYVSLLSKRRYEKGVKAVTHCSFEKMGAPLIVFSDDVSLKNGRKMYGVHFEVVAYEEGCNIWYIYPDETARLGRTSVLIASSKFKIENGSRIEISVEVRNKKIIACVNEMNLEVEHPEIPESCRIGITACEGINRFYDFEVEELKSKSR